MKKKELERRIKELEQQTRDLEDRVDRLERESIRITPLSEPTTNKVWTAPFDPNVKVVFSAYPTYIVSDGVVEVKDAGKA